mmetsp:Transcript_22163/g.46636  ORF Transcript_22163/g.46636 Transcript_22163/m.46636 type:complete len:205 (+) Transcript_22163:121-735(+)|eukprot:CAMPEP_0171358564 /NCGR_PEP_ID=MMETSP0879-20121228/61_1 /TAXON_ID=67004 /ORGANISM="Thalassiosira weissflogii, Strain CCMP1336" /LENGTH=204 /DNA_ID=CAMNT_0011864641 /DNA_START=121 /DNA_END=735 /DNA_ORIENTATION=-
MTSSIKTVVLLSAMALAGVFSFSPSIPPFRKRTAPQHNSVLQQRPNEPQHVNIQSPLATALASSTTNDSTSETITYEPPEDAIIQIKPKAMSRLIELKQKRDNDPKNSPDFDPSSPLILRMGVRNGGCSGLSYVMDFSTEEDIGEEDEIDEYLTEGIKCVVDAKSLLYLYGLELDYSDELIGGGFKFFNPNAEESCGCGSSFGV